MEGGRARLIWQIKRPGDSGSDSRVNIHASLFLLLSKYEIEATLSAAKCRVGFFTPWGKEIDTMRYWQSRGAARNNEMGKAEGKEKKSAFFDMQLF